MVLHHPQLIIFNISDAMMRLICTCCYCCFPSHQHLLFYQESYPEARRLVDSGEMIPDQMVCDLLLEALLLDEPGLQDDLGFVVDGFPRTATQVKATACSFCYLCCAIKGRKDANLYAWHGRGWCMFGAAGGAAAG
jgi:hypothetical protein